MEFELIHMEHAILATTSGKTNLRALVAISQATGTDLEAWESTPALQEEAFKKASHVPWGEAKVAVASFFTSLGLSLPASLASSAEETETPAPADLSQVVIPEP